MDFVGKLITRVYVFKHLLNIRMQVPCLYLMILGETETHERHFYRITLLLLMFFKRESVLNSLIYF